MEMPQTKNSARTAEYLARMGARRANLETQLNRILKGSSGFIWEVGCGHGHFLTAYAQAHPHQVCIGIDLAAERITRAARKCTRAGLANLFFIQAEAKLFLEVIPSAAAISDIFILFPDPWPKSRHHKHRILQPAFLSQAAARATDDCRLFFRTDFRPYFDDTQSLLQTHPDWHPAGVAWPFEYTTVFQSRAPDYYSLEARRTPRLPRP